MEDLILTSKEHKVLKKFKKRLQKRYNVKIQMPDIVTAAESDIIFVSINGEMHNRERVKKFLSEKMNMKSEKVECKKDILLITLSDSEEEPACDLETEANSVSVVGDTRQNSPHLVDELTLVNPLESSVCIIETPVISKCSVKRSKNITNDQIHYVKEKQNSFDNSVCVIESPVIITSRLCRSIASNKNDSQERRECRNIKMTNRRKKSKGTLPYSHHFEETELCEVSSTTDEVVASDVKFSDEAGILTQDLTDYIPLHKKRKSYFDEVEPSTDSHDSSSIEGNDDVIVLDEPSSAAIRSLRPVVIDGSNVAIEHGKVSHTFSAKGIQLAVDYFLNRGHTQVTAFVPRFRRFCNRKNFPTTDPEILDDLAKKQQVVFTPSRRINGKCIASYDDRFIVQLATTNGGVIVSNDNYRDLASENESFKEVIENRLLMFCFVGDIFMIPSDPLGRNGPSLSEFLTFPPDS